jgi:flagella basal body P-ring formation protein FlgA
MISSANACFAALLGGLLAAAPPGPAEQLAASVAGEWGVAPERVHLELPALPVHLAGLPVTLRIAGRGAGGWLAVVAEAPGAEPAAFRVRCGVRDTVWLAEHALARGTRISPGDLRTEVRVRWGAPAPARGGQPTPGWEVRRPIAAGEVVAWPAAVAPALVETNDPVRLEWTFLGVRIERTGVALHAAGAGEIVRVRIDGGGAKVVEARVVAPGRAVLDSRRGAC